jgi:hypothetical protein
MEIIHPLALIVSRNIIPCLDVFIIEKKKPENGEAGDKLLLPAQMPVGQLKI